jgi:hypothetical protein
LAPLFFNRDQLEAVVGAVLSGKHEAEVLLRQVQREDGTKAILRALSHLATTGRAGPQSKPDDEDDDEEEMDDPPEVAPVFGRKVITQQYAMGCGSVLSGVHVVSVRAFIGCQVDEFLAELGDSPLAGAGGSPRPPDVISFVNTAAYGILATGLGAGTVRALPVACVREEAESGCRWLMAACDGLSCQYCCV